jgi:hypothetical protein
VPSPRRDRETAPTAVSLQFREPVSRSDRAPGEPGPGNKNPIVRAQRRHRGLTPVTPRNSLPEFTPYVTREIREYYASQGITLQGRSYNGTGHDMTGDCMCGTPCQWSAHGANFRGTAIYAARGVNDGLAALEVALEEVFLSA